MKKFILIKELKLYTKIHEKNILNATRFIKLKIKMSEMSNNTWPPTQSGTRYLFTEKNEIALKNNG